MRPVGGPLVLGPSTKSSKSTNGSSASVWPFNGSNGASKSEDPRTSVPRGGPVHPEAGPSNPPRPRVFIPKLNTSGLGGVQTLILD